MPICKEPGCGKRCHSEFCYSHKPETKSKYEERKEQAKVSRKETKDMIELFHTISLSIQEENGITYKKYGDQLKKFNLL